MNITAESLPFQQHDPEPAAVFVRFAPVQKLPKPEVNAVYESGRYFAGTTVYYCDYPESDPYARLCAESGTGTWLLEYLSDFEERFSTSQTITNHLGLETLLLTQSVLLLHSSFIQLPSGCGILFSAPSGTGKSTQADLWHKYRHADIINGDRAGLRKIGDSWKAWGLPYAGTSGVYRNEVAPISSIVVLRQSKLNTIRRLRPAEAMRYLYPELTLHRWEAGSVAKAMDLLTDLVSSVPIFLLECRPGEEAVNLLDATLKEVIS